MTDTTAHEDAVRMFTRLLDTASALAPAIHRAAWRAAVAAGDTALQRILIQRHDAPADLVTTYATLTSTELRGLYLARPDVDEQTLAAQLVGETRAGVLAEALQRSKQHPAVVAVARDQFLARPTKALAPLMANLPAAQLTPEVSEAILRVYDRTDPVSVAAVPQTATYLSRLRPEQATALLGQLNHPECLTALLRLPVNEAAIDAMLDRVLPGLLQRSAAGKAPALWGATYDLCVHAVCGRRDSALIADTIRRHLAAWTGTSVATLRATVGDPHTWARHTGRRVTFVTDADPKASPSPDPVSSETAGDRLERLAVSPDPATVAAVVRQVLATSATGQPGVDRSRWETISRLLRNPALTADQRRQLLENLRDGDAEPRGMQDLDPITLFPHDQLAAQVWCRLFPLQVLNRHGWEPFGGRQAAAALVPAWARDPNENSQTALVHAALKVGFDPQILLDVPQPVIARMWRWSGHRDSAAPLMLELAGGLLAEHLGDDPAAWELFHRLAPAFTGTLGDLLHVSATAAA